MQDIQIVDVLPTNNQGVFLNMTVLVDLKAGPLAWGNQNLRGKTDG
jgi:hypothetical protein